MFVELTRFVYPVLLARLSGFRSAGYTDLIQISRGEGTRAKQTIVRKRGGGGQGFRNDLSCFRCLLTAWAVFAGDIM